jgi:hypothetical protein
MGADIEDILDDPEETQDLIKWLTERQIRAGSSLAVDYLHFYIAVLSRFKRYKTLQRQGLETQEIKREMTSNALEIFRNFNGMGARIECKIVTDIPRQIWKSRPLASAMDFISKEDCSTFPDLETMSRSLMPIWRLL